MGVQRKAILEKERAIRIRLCVAACFYELLNHSMISDCEFDLLCSQVDLSLRPSDTYAGYCDLNVYKRQRRLDFWFKNNFKPFTGLWIHTHPELDRLKDYCEAVKCDKEDKLLIYFFKYSSGRTPNLI
jgi:hypothetical protein